MKQGAKKLASLAAMTLAVDRLVKGDAVTALLLALLAAALLWRASTPRAG